MKLKLLFLLQLMAIQPLHAAVLGSSGQTSNTSATTGNASTKGSASTALPLPAPAQKAESITIPSDISNLTSEQTRQLMDNADKLTPEQKQQLFNQAQNLTPQQQQQLMKSAKDMNPQELQAIAKTLSATAQAKTPQGQPQFQAVAKTQTKNIDPDAGLIEEVVPAAAQQAAKTSAKKEVSVDEMKRQQAFNTLMQEVLPLSPEQINDLHHFYDLTLQAKATTPAPPPTPNFTSIVVNLEPGSQPPVIRLSAGFVTSVLFIDSTGAPWPITAYSIGDPQNFNIQWDQKGNAMFIQSMKQYSHGNLAVRLWGLDTPVMVTLVSGQRSVDFRVDLQVLGRGPDAKPPVVETTYSAKVNPLLINILDGIPPKESLKLSVSGGHGEAWLADGRVYFRTKLTVLSPAWTATVSSPDGTHVYEMMLTPFILASQNGKTIDIKLSGL